MPGMIHRLRTSPAGVVFLIAALGVMGCWSPSSSDDNAIPAKAAGKSGTEGTAAVFKCSLDPQAGTLEIEPVVMGSALSTTHYGGVLDVSTDGVCSPGAKLATCQVTVTNLTPGYYFTNLRTWAYGVTEPSATLRNADYPEPGPVPLEGSGLCVVNDGVYRFTSQLPQEDYGCDIYTYRGNFDVAVVSILHPDCGSITSDWTFGVTSIPYSFYLALVDSLAGNTADLASMYPEDPTAGDPRMDFTNYSTFVARPYGLDNACPNDACKSGEVEEGTRFEQAGCIGRNNNMNGWGEGWKLGAPGCSTPLPGNGAIPAGAYFAVNLGIEIADRVEAQNHAQLNRTAACFEWYHLVAMNITWDPTVLEALNVEGAVQLAGGTVLDITSERSQFMGSLSGNGDGGVRNYFNEWDGLDLEFLRVVDDNFMAVARAAPYNNVFSFRGGLSNPRTCRPDIYNDTGYPYGTTAGYPISPLGWHGLAHYDAGCTGLTDQGADAEVDEWLALQYFHVIGPPGSNSLIKIEPTGDFTGIFWNHSNCTRDGGWAGDDISNWCYPCTNKNKRSVTGPCDNSGPGDFTCDGGADDLFMSVFNGIEMTQPALPGGPNSYRGKGYQTQNAHVCVQ